jgi:hypothetical protein
MAEEQEEKQGQPTSTIDRDRRIVARFLDLLAAGFVALAVAIGFDGEYGRATAALISGLAVFLCGIYWSQIRRKIGPSLSQSMVVVASSAWSWLFVLFVVFCYIAAPSVIGHINRLPLSYLSSGTASRNSSVKPSDTATSAIPTWLILWFNYSGEPTTKSGANIHWWWWNSTEKSSSLGVPSILGIDNTTTVLFLSCDTPVNLDNISLKAERDLPRYEIVKKIDNRIIVIWIHGKISGDLYVEVIK